MSRPRVCIRVVLAATLAAAASAPAADERPNVLIVSIDSLRRDALGCYGARLPHAPGLSPSPNLDGLAAAGVRMTEAYASSPWTLPSHVSLLTGQSPLVHRVETDLQKLADGSRTLAEILRAAGYRTAGVFSAPYLEPQWGFGRGFERYRAAYGDPVAQASHALDRLDAEIAAAERRGDRITAEELMWRRRTEYERVRALSHVDVSSEAVTRTALNELDTFGRGTPAPWFLFVHYFDVHYDYVPPPPYDGRFDPSYTGTMTGRGFLTNDAIGTPDPHTVEGYVRRVSDRDLDHLRALYAGEVALVDEHVGRILRRLDAMRAAERTLVVVVSDHGDEFFEHGGIGHRRNLSEAVIRIPMILRLPGVLPAGRAVPGLVSLSDVAPTILGQVGIAVPESMSGASMAPLVDGSERGGKRLVLSRLVRMYDGTVRIDDRTVVPVRMAVVREAFRQGTIKIVRRRRWPLIPPRLPQATQDVLQEFANRQFREEEREWIDLERFPDEPPHAYSADFRDPALHRVLGVYRTRYLKLRETNAVLTRSDAPDAALRGKLEGLGYLDVTEAPTSPRDGFVLPVPVDRRTEAPR